MIAEIDTPDLPEGWTAAQPTPDDVPELVELLSAIQIQGRGYSTADEESIAASTIGEGSWTRRQLVIRDPDGDVVAWPTVHDRAAGRTMVDLDIHPAAERADDLAYALLPWLAEHARQVSVLRGLTATQLDATVFAGDDRAHTWLVDAGYTKVRTMSQMTRPVTPEEADADAEFTGDDATTRVRTIGTYAGTPIAEDLQAVHQLLEDSFGDHFNSHRESFPEFVHRLREDPGHRWDHWWLAEILEGDTWIPAGALVGSELGKDMDGKEGSYVDYVGVGRHARGRGAGKGLLLGIIADAARRGRNRVDLEVDDESPTGANDIYTAFGWKTKYVLESWHKDIDVDPRTEPGMMGEGVQTLVEWLEYFRATLDMKCNDLSPVQLATAPLPFNDLSLLGLIRHMTEVEHYWFDHIAGGNDITAVYCADDPNADFFGGSVETVDADVAAFHAAIAASRERLLNLEDIDEALPNQRQGQDVNLRWILNHLASEYARHCGHADLIREAIDGRTGE